MAMDQDRRDAIAWAKEWQIRQKNRRILYCLILLVAVVAVYFIIEYIIVLTQRTTFGSVEEMRAAMQGRYAVERDLEDLVIDGDDVTLTYYAMTHYDRDYAERYGYDYDEHDSVYDDHVREWDYRHGVIETGWMGGLIVDKDGNITRGDSYITVFYKTDKPHPEPIDPESLTTPEGIDDEEVPPEEAEAIEEREESMESDQEASEEAEYEDEDEQD